MATLSSLPRQLRGRSGQNCSLEACCRQDASIGRFWRFKLSKQELLDIQAKRKRVKHRTSLIAPPCIDLQLFLGKCARPAPPELRYGNNVFFCTLTSGLSNDAVDSSALSDLPMDVDRFCVQDVTRGMAVLWRSSHPCSRRFMHRYSQFVD
jgi:hypothetical protein